jgi:hypothetical protein
MAKVAPLRAGLPGKPQGVFKVEKFSMFEAEGLEAYANLRNRAADATSGIKIELMREYSRKTTETSGEGDSQVFTTTEEVILVVHYWEKPVVRKKGDSDDEVADARSTLTPG